MQSKCLIMITASLTSLRDWVRYVEGFIGAQVTGDESMLSVSCRKLLNHNSSGNDEKRHGGLSHRRSLFSYRWLTERSNRSNSRELMTGGLLLTQKKTPNCFLGLRLFNELENLTNVCAWTKSSKLTARFIMFTVTTVALSKKKHFFWLLHIAAAFINTPSFFWWNHGRRG